ncbi:MAG: PQQ-dependent dehydrogenase, methanol/ethanol family [Gammaproteobacteria bacterium]|nr:PQQ-dependent dehydrogenase, methanol/ethanol family [Gammaproteobacteria bacterium]
MRFPALLLLLVASFAAHPSVDHEQLVNVDNTPGSWLTHGRNYAEDRQSPLTQITPDNVGELGLTWYFDTGTGRGLEASPLVIDGVIYSTGSWSRVFANNAVSGEPIWQYDPQVPRAWGVNACCDVVNRGVAAWGDNIYLGTLDGRLVALNRRNGKVVWTSLTIDPARPYTITGAPRIIKGNVIIGNGGAEYGVRGYVSAYDARDGALRWRFYTVPGNPENPFESAAMEMAAKTWSGDLWWKVGGGGTVWDSMAYDVDLDLLYIGVGNGAPWNRHVRSPGGGDNLFLSSIVALRPETGEYVWHYQTTPGDSWDYTATQHMILADLVIDGALTKVLMQAPKNGFFYVLDRASGKLISAEKYAPATWASHVDLSTGRPVETENADHSIEVRMTKPAAFGGHNWQPMAFNQTTGLVYIPAMETAGRYSTDHDFTYQSGGHWNTGQSQEGGAFPANRHLVNAVIKRLFKGHLLAWDPVKQTEVWRVAHEAMWNGGVLTTAANLVFQGTGDGRLVAYRADSGEQLWDTHTLTGVVAPPISYQINGEQYVAVMAGWGGAPTLLFDLPGSTAGANGRLLVYKLGGELKLPDTVEANVIPTPPPRHGSEESIATGQVLYNTHCGRCHGIGLVGSGLLPDLRDMGHDMSGNTPEVFKAIVLQGAYREMGMVSFADVMSEADADAVYDYIVDAAHARWEEQQSSPVWSEVEAWIMDWVGALIAQFI